MFTLLSNQATLLALFKTYSAEEKIVTVENLTLIINSLSKEVALLLKNRRNHGVLLPEGVSQTPAMDEDMLVDLGLKNLLLNKSYLLTAINTLCLTEAIFVRDNFSNCITLIADELPLAKKATVLPQVNKAITSDKNNVSPIRLSDIKQRLAQAVLDSDKKNDLIKNKLNNLLLPEKSSHRISTSLQA